MKVNKQFLKLLYDLNTSDTMLSRNLILLEIMELKKNPDHIQKALIYLLEEGYLHSTSVTGTGIVYVLTDKFYKYYLENVK